MQYSMLISYNLFPTRPTPDLKCFNLKMKPAYFNVNVGQIPFLGLQMTKVPRS